MRLACLLIVLALLSGCQMAVAPELIQVHALSASSVTLGDHLEIVGDGFPEGKAARVTFLGTLYRPGQRPIEGVEITLDGRSRSQRVVSVSFDEAVEARFCGKNAYAEHTTFRGDVRVAFASRSASAPPVLGTLLGASLDVAPAAYDPDALARAVADAGPMIELLGVVLEPVRDPAGLAIRRLESGKAADVAGLRPDDVLTELDGVALNLPSDLRLAPGTELAHLAVRRAGTKATADVAVDVSPLHPRSGRDWGPSFGLLTVAIALFGFFAGPLTRVVNWIEHLTEQKAHLLALRGLRARSWGSALRALLLRRGVGEARSTGALAYAVFLVVSAGFTLMAFGGSLRSDDVDLGFLTALSVALSLVARLVAGGTREPGRWSLVAGVTAALRRLPSLLVLLLAVAAVIMASESVSLRQVVELQGSAPWRWSAFQNPGLFALAVLLLLSATPHNADGDWSELEAIGVPPAPPPRGIVLICEWASLWIVAGLATCLFFGGWRFPLMPFGTPPAVEATLGAVVLHAKLWACALAIVGLRAVSARVTPEPMLGQVMRWWLPTAVASAALAVSWAEGAERYDLPRAALGGALCVFCALITAHLLRRIHRRAANPATHGGVNPWL